MTDWSGTIETQLNALGAFLRNSSWYGRENEVVNLFAHSFLARLLDPAQIGIEVAVKQLARDGGKVLVRKDLVIWKGPNETVWRNGNPTNDPAAIIEFKVNDNKKCAPDLAWLRSYTKVYPTVLGYSVCGYLKERRGVSFHRITKGQIENSNFNPSDVL